MYLNQLPKWILGTGGVQGAEEEPSDWEDTTMILPSPHQLDKYLICISRYGKFFG